MVLIENKRLFNVINPETGKYSGRLHLSQIPSYLGIPPKDLLSRSPRGYLFDVDGALAGLVGKVHGKSTNADAN